MSDVRRWWIGFGLAAGLAAVLAGPVWLIWTMLQPPQWDSATLRIRFESVRYERAGLTFTYQVENRTGHRAYFRPERTQLRAVQDNSLPVAGYPNMRLPLELPAHSRQEVEIRLEVPTPRDFSGITSGQTGRIFSKSLNPSDLETPGSTLPMLGLMPSPQKTQQIRSAEDSIRSVENSLRTVDGFELVDVVNNVRIHFPRGW